MKKYIGMVTFGNLKYTRLTVEGIKRSSLYQRKELNLVVVVGKPGDKDTLHYIEDSLDLGEDGKIIVQNVNAGFVSGLGLIYSHAWRDGLDNLLMTIGNDVVPFPDSIDSLFEVAESENLDYVGGLEVSPQSLFKRLPQYRWDFHAWEDLDAEFPWGALDGDYERPLLREVRRINGYHNFAVISKTYFDAVGYPDCNFYPAYYEDVDIVRRGFLSDMTHYENKTARYLHFRSQTLKTEQSNSRSSEWFTMNSLYYNMKWGGTPGHETNLIPFGGADATICPWLKIGNDKYKEGRAMFGVDVYYRWTPRFFRDIHKGQRMVIVGGGPSINGVDFSKINNEIIMGLNRIYLKEDDINLSYLVAVNGQVLEDYGEEIVEVQTAATFISRNTKSSEQLWRPHVYGLGFGSPQDRFFQTNADGLMYQGHTVTYCALQLAYYMGITDVCLLGIDHSYPRAEGLPTNLPIISKGKDTDHFDPDYFKEGVTWETPNLERSEEAYEMAKHAFEADGRRIVNCTSGTKLDVFDKMELNEWIRTRR